MYWYGKGNIEYMDRCGYSFIIMMKGMASFVNQLILENKGKFEGKCRKRSVRIKDRTYDKVSKEIFQ